MICYRLIGRVIYIVYYYFWNLFWHLLWHSFSFIHWYFWLVHCHNGLLFLSFSTTFLFYLFNTFSLEFKLYLTFPWCFSLSFPEHLPSIFLCFLTSILLEWKLGSMKLTSIFWLTPFKKNTHISFLLLPFSVSTISPLISFCYLIIYDFFHRFCVSSIFFKWYVYGKLLPYCIRYSFLFLF